MLTDGFPVLLLACLGFLLLPRGTYRERLGQANNRRIDLARVVPWQRGSFHERRSEQRFLYKGRLPRRIEFNTHAIHARLEGILWTIQIILYIKVWSKLQRK